MVIKNLKKKVNRRNTYRCICGQTFRLSYNYREHKDKCEVLKNGTIS